MLLNQNLKTLLEYKADFIILSVAYLMTNILGFIFLSVIYLRVPQINGWRFEEISLIYGMVIFAEGALSFFFEGMWLLPNKIHTGALDQHILRPVSPVLQILSSKIGMNGFGSMLIGSIIFIKSAFDVNIHWSLYNIVCFIIFLISSVCIAVFISFTANCFSFWIDGAGITLPVAINGFHEFGKYPINIYSIFMQIGITFIIPYAFVGFVPVSFLLDKNEWGNLAYFSPLIAVYCVLIGLFVFKRGLNKYESVGN